MNRFKLMLYRFLGIELPGNTEYKIAMAKMIIKRKL